jgi:hypothetical protein
LTDGRGPVRHSPLAILVRRMGDQLLVGSLRSSMIHGHKIKLDLVRAELRTG